MGPEGILSLASERSVRKGISMLQKKKNGVSILVLHLLDIIRKTGRFRAIAERVVRSRVAVSSQGQG